MSGASQVGLPDNGEEDGIITPQLTPGAQEAQPLGQEELPGAAPISLTRSEKMGGAALDKKGIQAGEAPSESRAEKMAKQQADAAEMAGVPLATPIAEDTNPIIPEKEKVKTKLGTSSTPADLGNAAPAAANARRPTPHHSGACRLHADDAYAEKNFFKNLSAF